MVSVVEPESNLFESKDNFDQITTWYASDPQNTGWKCAGGTGSYDSPRMASGVNTCQNGKLVYTLHLAADENKTEFQVAIPTKK